MKLNAETINIFSRQWQIDTHSTILSRKNSYHKRSGKLLLVKPRKQSGQTISEKLDSSPLLGGGLLAMVGIVVAVIILTF